MMNLSFNSLMVVLIAVFSSSAYAVEANRIAECTLANSGAAYFDGSLDRSVPKTIEIYKYLAPSPVSHDLYPGFVIAEVELPIDKIPSEAQSISVVKDQKLTVLITLREEANGDLSVFRTAALDANPWMVVSKSPSNGSRVPLVWTVAGGRTHQYFCSSWWASVLHPAQRNALSRQTNSAGQ